MFEAIHYQKDKIELWVLHTFIDLMENSTRFQEFLRGSHRVYKATRQAWPNWSEWLLIAIVFSGSLAAGYFL